jgi:hypothetical protein
MADRVLKDKRGFIIGRISTRSDGVQTIKDERGFMKGTYDPKTDKTKDHRGFVVGSELPKLDVVGSNPIARSRRTRRPVGHPIGLRRVWRQP